MKNILLLVFIFSCLFMPILSHSETIDQYWGTITEKQLIIDIKNGELLNYKTNPYISDAIVFAAKNTQNPNILNILVNAGENINTTKKGLTPLITASAFNHNPNIINTLIKLGANVNYKTPEGITALYTACSEKNINAVTILLNYTKKLNFAEQSACSEMFFGGINNTYVIEIAHNDEFFIINGEKFSAQTYCFASDGFDQGDYVVFLDGSPLGACATATIANPLTGETCELWCE